MEPTTTNTDVTFADYLRPVWRFKFFVLAAVVIVAAATYVFYDHKQKLYESATQVYVGPSALAQTLSATSNTPSATSDRSLANQARLVTTAGVARAAARRLGGQFSPESLLGSVSVASSSDTDFLAITAQARDPALAARIANSFATAYLAQRRSQVVSSAQRALDDVRNRLDRLGERGSSATRNALEDQITTLEGAVAAPPSPGQQVSVAPVIATPVSPKPKRNAIFAAVLALVLSIIAAYLFDRGDRRVRGLTEVEELFGLPVLTAIPRVRNPDHASALEEPHRALRVNLDLQRGPSGASVIMFASALPAEGKSTVIQHLAQSYREAGASVAVLEADLRRPVLAEKLGVESQPGLSEALSRRTDLHLQRVPGGDARGSIDVAVAGGFTESPTVLLTADRLRPIIADLKRSYDVVLVDTAPILSVSDALPLAGVVDGVVFVVRSGTSTHPAAQRMRRTLERMRGVTLIGSVANNVEDEHAGYYGFVGRSSAPAQTGLAEGANG